MSVVGYYYCTMLILDSRFWGKHWGGGGGEFDAFFNVFCILVFFWGDLKFWGGGSPQEMAGNITDYCMKVHECFWNLEPHEYVLHNHESRLSLRTTASKQASKNCNYKKRHKNRLAGHSDHCKTLNSSVVACLLTYFRLGSQFRVEL